MSVSDTEASELTWTDNGTFNLSEGHTPQTENSEGTFAYVGGCFCRLHVGTNGPQDEGLVPRIRLQLHVCPHGVVVEAGADQVDAKVEDFFL